MYYEPIQRAKAAILSARIPEELPALRDRVDRSTLLTRSEKEDMYFQIEMMPGIWWFDSFVSDSRPQVGDLIAARKLRKQR